MAYWIHMVMLIVQSFTNAEGVFYVSEEKVSSDKAASSCNLATPDIYFGKDWNTISLDDADLNISETEPVWSGYVQTYAAFLYEGCCEKQFANSKANHTNMYMDPGDCYSRCETDVIGMQETTCHCKPTPKEEQKHAYGCNSICSNPEGTLCGGRETISIYRKVEYRKSGGGAATDNGNCRAFYWDYDDQQSFTWRNCSTEYPYLCDTDVSSSAEFEYHGTWKTWRRAAGRCLTNYKKPAGEILTRIPYLTFGRSVNIWIGIVRSLVISKNADSNDQAPGWRRGVITKAGEKYVLHFHASPTKLKSLCENALTSETTNDEPQFPMIAVYAAVPAVVVIVVVLVIVIICKRRRNTECGIDDQALSQENYQTSVISRYAVVNYSHQECGVDHGYVTLDPVITHAVVRGPDINAAVDNEYDTCTNLPKKSNAMSNESGNVYNTLEDIGDDTYNHTNTTTATIVDDTYDNATFDEHG